MLKLLQKFWEAVAHFRISTVMLMLVNAATGLLTPGSVKSIAIIGGPAHAGFISSVAAFWAFALNIALPYIIAVLIPDNSFDSWNRAFYMAAAIATLGAVVFFLFGSGELQEWAKEKASSPEKSSTKIHPVKQQAVDFTNCGDFMHDVTKFWNLLIILYNSAIIRNAV